MLQDTFEQLLAFAAKPPKTADLAAARHTYEAATGQIFEGDASFERRIAAFLEWYVLDAAQPGGNTVLGDFAAQHGQVDVAAAPPTAPTGASQDTLVALQHARLRLLEICRLRPHQATLQDLVSKEKLVLTTCDKLLGCDSGTVLLARPLRLDGELVLTDGVLYLPAAGRKPARTAGKLLRKRQAAAAEQLAAFLRLAYFANRCERYRHVDPKTIFAEWTPSA